MSAAIPTPLGFKTALAVALLLAAPLQAVYAEQSTPAEKSVVAPRNLKVSVKMIGPVTQTADLQIICLLKHDPAGDKYIEAMQEFNDKLGGLLSALRERGEFIGDLGETLLFTPPSNSITPKQVLLIGVGEEATLSLDKLKVVGRIAAREAVRLKAVHVSFAPTLRDQGSSRIDVGEGDGAVAEQVVLAYDTEKRMQEQGLAAKTEDMAEFVVEAGPKYFEGTVTHVSQAVEQAAAVLKQRDAKTYASPTDK